MTPLWLVKRRVSAELLIHCEKICIDNLGVSGDEPQFQGMLYDLHITFHTLQFLQIPM